MDIFGAKIHTPDYIQGSVGGMITTLSVINGAIGAGVSLRVVITLGVINIISDGFVAAASKYLSARAEEKLLQKENPNAKRSVSPLVSALTSFFSFAIAGMIPLLPLILKYQQTGDQVRPEKIHHLAYDTYYMMSFVFTAMGLFAVGYVWGKLENAEAKKVGTEVLLVGGFAACISLMIGDMFHRSSF